MAQPVKPFVIKKMPGFTAMAFFVFAMLYAPIFLLIVYSFNATDSVAVWGGFSLRWYEAAWNNREIKEAALRSIMVAGIAGTLSTAAATLAALATARGKPFRGITVLYSIINLPLMVPEIVTAVALLIFFASIKVSTGYQGIGYVLAAHTAFSPVKAFRYVTLPLLWPGIMAGFMLAFVISLDDVVITDHIKSVGQETLPTYMLGKIRRLITPEINAVSAIFFLASMLLVTLFFFMNRKK
jgi:spermidine/putrescine transport system permease protein